MGPGDQTWVMRLGGKHLNPQSHLTGPPEVNYEVKGNVYLESSKIPSLGLGCSSEVGHLPGIQNGTQTFSSSSIFGVILNGVGKCIGRTDSLDCNPVSSRYRLCRHGNR